MPSSVAVLGPFVGGLNKASDASAIADNELSECVNLNVDLDGSLVCRPPIAQAGAYNYNLTGNVRVIGNANINNIPYVIVCSAAGVHAVRFHSDPNTIENILIAGNVQSDCAVQLHNVLFVLATYQSPEGSGVWNGATYTTSASSPRGSSALFFKGRIFAAPGAFYDSSIPASTQLVFSDPVPLTLPIAIPWNAVNLIPVGQGDGENLIDMLVVADNLMLFKNNSTYAYMYDVSPNEGILRKVNNDIGTSAQFCVLTHQNEAYTYHEGSLYQIANYTFVKTNIKLPFQKNVIEDSRREKVSLSLLGDTILVRYFDNLYALSLVTKTWSEWKSAHATLNSLGHLVKLETNAVSSKLELYFGGSVSPNNYALMTIRETHIVEYGEYAYQEVADSENGFVVPVPIECTMATKVYDFGSPHLFKRLMWWGIDLISDGHVWAYANPVRQTKPVTWDVLAEYTWDQLGPWDNLLLGSGYIETDVNDLFVLRRKFMKALKSLRFRQVSFIVKFFSTGKIAPDQTLGPARIFTISAIVGAKQTVVKQVS